MSRKISQAFLLLADKATDAVIRSYQKLQDATKELGDIFILYHQKETELPDKLKGIDHFTFTNSVITQNNYIPIGFSLIPGNNHFPVLQFATSHPNYDYYWCIEEDVKFSGNWKFFFDFFSSIPMHFLTSHIRTSKEEPNWYWWHALAHPYTVIPLERRIRSFNPIYRISREALETTHNALVSRWCGHHEVLMVTLLNERGLEIADFGGKGKFVLPGLENRFYLASSSNKEGELRDGTMRWRPVFDAIGDLPDKLYHPVKL